MARQNLKRHATDEVQGEGSYIEMRAFTVAEFNDMLRIIGRVQELAAMEAGDEAARAKVRAEADEYESAMRQLYARHIVKWNWVDDDNEPLPLPADDLTVFDRLTVQEMAVINSILRGVTTGEKKDTTKSSR